jgi:alpha-L-arabinofuranosidase
MENVIKFCGIAGAEIVIQVNIESGTAEEAADWVRYMNIEKGAKVTYWELGNEVYGDWDRGYMTGKDYVKVIKEYSALMKQVDPTIKIGANWGGVKYQEFDEAVAQGSFNDIDFVSYHWYPNHINNNHRYQERNHPYPEELMANSLAVEKLVKRFEEMVDKYAPQRKGKIEFTIMEWDGSWDGVASDLYYQYKGRMWSLANAIFYANALGEFAKHGVTVANQFTYQEIMFGFIRGWDVDAGWGGSHWDGETIRPKGLAFKLLARYFGDTLVESTLKGSPNYHKEADWRPDSFTGEVPYVESFVSRSSKDETLSILLTNKHEETDFTVFMTINSTAELAPTGEVWILNGPELRAQNDGSPGEVDIQKYHLSGIQNKFSYTVPAHSVNLLKIPFRNRQVNE